MKRAIKAVEERTLSIRRAAQMFDVPYETNKITHPFNKEKGMCGKDWIYSFMRRYPQLSFRKPEATSLSRVTEFNRGEMDVFFNNLELLFEKYHFEIHRIYNVDETGISTVHNPGRILARKGEKQVGAITSGERGQNTTITLILPNFFGNAYNRVTTIEKALNGFKTTGIFPINRDAFCEEDFVPLHEDNNDAQNTTAPGDLPLQENTSQNILEPVEPTQKTPSPEPGPSGLEWNCSRKIEQIT
ncbi:hypothetical protein NQ318_007506 [Aromia moschata]|uniref:HTH psq-type domain-containing protein n=1 Tax=Aromia moschata TaxID=1265417 RepID=A0AAV8YEV7_9CUCU|nr:hypothetical protein NQ318_007506 [Aromia moschata]